MTTDGIFQLSDVSCARVDDAALRGISAAFNAGTFNLLRGDPNCGKATVLRVLGLLERPRSGEVLVLGEPTFALSEEARAELRGRRFGYVFEAPFLLRSFSVIENVAMPLFRLSHVGAQEARERTEEILDFVGLASAAQESINHLSLTAQHRVSLARGLINAPSFLIVENLDGVLAGDDLQSFATLLRQACARFGVTVFASVSPSWEADDSARTIDMKAGVIVRDTELLREPRA